MFYQISFSQQVKWCTIISYKHAIYDLPHELLNDLVSQETTKYQESSKTPENDSQAPSLPAKMKTLLLREKNSWKTKIKAFP